MAIEVVSIELTNLCSKACDWGTSKCYNSSNPKGATLWVVDELAGFIKDLAENGVRAVSFGGGEPLQYREFWPLMEAVSRVPVFRSMTTNGLPLTEEKIKRLAGYLDKVHVSIHFPDNEAEVTRVIGQVLALESAGLKSGINFLVAGKTEIEQAAVRRIVEAGIGPERVVFLPMRMGGAVDMVKFKAVAGVMGEKWQSMSCLLACKSSPRFASVGWDRRAGLCSYTVAKTLMKELTYAGMAEAIGQKELVYCG